MWKPLGQKVGGSQRRSVTLPVPGLSTRTSAGVWSRLCRRPCTPPGPLRTYLSLAFLASGTMDSPMFPLSVCSFRQVSHPCHTGST